MKESTQVQFERLDKRIGRLDERIDGLTSLLENHVSETNRRFDSLTEYADQILDNVCNISGKLLDGHERRLQRLEKQLGVVA